MQESIAFPGILFGKIKSFSECGPRYQVGQAVRRPPDGDWLGMAKPPRRLHQFGLVLLFQFWYILP